MFDRNNNYNTELPHADGVHNLEITIDGEEAVIRFGSSFTLRMTEDQVDELRDILYETARHIDLVRPVPDVVQEKPATQPQSKVDDAESYFIDEGIRAREALKAKRRSQQQTVDVWDPHDPVNW